MGPSGPPQNEHEKRQKLSVPTFLQHIIYDAKIATSPPGLVHGACCVAPDFFSAEACGNPGSQLQLPAHAVSHHRFTAGPRAVRGGATPACSPQGCGVKCVLNPVLCLWKTTHSCIHKGRSTGNAQQHHTNLDSFLCSSKSSKFSGLPPCLITRSIKKDPALVQHTGPTFHGS